MAWQLLQTVMILPCFVGRRKDWRSHSGSHIHCGLLMHILLNLDSFLNRLIKTHAQHHSALIQQDSEPSSGQGIELRLLLLRLGLGRALGSSCRWCRPSSWWRSAWASWPQRPRGWYRYLPGQDQVTEHHRGLVQALLLNESILVQSNSLDDLASPFTKTDMRKKPCLMLMLLSHVRKPPSLPNRLNLCSVRLTSKLSRSNMAHEDFRIWNY